jgi:hypothetical protein
VASTAAEADSKIQIFGLENLNHHHQANGLKTGGAEGNRTPDLLNAIQALSQLSYGPIAWVRPYDAGSRADQEGLNKEMQQICISCPTH